MITIARLRSSKTPSKHKAAAAQTSVLAHRLFPGLCALWFAALFGLGALVASGEALGALVMHLHLPAILPAAAPPLGMTARLVLGLGFAGLGGAIGLAIGAVGYMRAGGIKPERPIRAATAPTPADEPAIRAERAVPGRAPRVRSRDAHPDAPPRRPLVVTEDVLPYPTAMVEPDPAPVEPMVGPAEADAAAADEEFTFAWAPHRDAPPADLPPFLAAAFSSVHNDAAPVFVAPAEPIILPAEPEPVALETVAPEPAIVEPVAPANPPPLASLAAAAPKVALVDLPLASLGLVQLIERLALAIATRQTLRAADVAAPDHSDAVDLRKPLHRFDPLSMDPTGPLLRAKKTRAEAGDEPAAEPDDAPRLHDPLASIAAWTDDHDGEAPPVRFLGQATAEPHDHPGDGAVVEHRYSSLTDMALPRPELVPSGDGETAEPAPAAPDPVVPFPSRLSAADPANPHDADRALREALATLRQMSAQR